MRPCQQNSRQAFARGGGATFLADWYGMHSDFHEIFFLRSTDRAHEIVGKAFEGNARGNVVVGGTHFGVVFPAAAFADVVLHSLSFLSLYKWGNGQIYKLLVVCKIMTPISAFFHRGAWWAFS